MRRPYARAEWIARSSFPRSRCVRLAQLDELLVLVADLARLEGAAALELGVELGAEQDADVRDPEPQQEDDRSRERPVRLVVRAEVGDVEGKEERRDHPAEDGEQAAGR